MNRLTKAISIITAGLFSPLLLDTNKVDSKRHAICILFPHQSKVVGVVSFSQDNINTPTKIACVIKGLTPNKKHGIHIHEFGDLSQGCATAGPHYNPHNKNHGGPFTQERHVGDLGNVSADQTGKAQQYFTDKVISLYGEYSIVGRSVVVHANTDDQGKTDHPQSKKTGNSGPRVACGIIGLSKSFLYGVPEDQKQ